MKQLLVIGLALASVVSAEDVLKAKNLPIFQVVKFPNDMCEVTGGTKNGTCYTAEECSDKGGKSDGSCADGYGVCCVFSMGCGTTTSENTTYFEQTSVSMTGGCGMEVCKCETNICQIRLDFQTFVISGPSTRTASDTTFGILNGDVAPIANGAAIADGGRCLTDTFQITNQRTVPSICGTNTGAHVYFDANEDCNSLDFQFGNSAVGIASVATRSFSIKVSQISCNDENLPPMGCTQYYYGTSGTNQVKTFNFDGGRHLADQAQNICVRRESGNCRICWSADAKSDVGTSGDKKATGTATGAIDGEVCCAYKDDGKITKNGYDCIAIPNAEKTDGAFIGDNQCAQNGGLITAAGAAGKTVCSKQTPFSIQFYSDTYEFAAATTNEASDTNNGFKLRYFQTTC